jgi:hypothetical protein
MNQAFDSITIEETELQEDSEVVFIRTNRWVPEKCMWTVEKTLLTPNKAIVFPFPELSASICHILVGTAGPYKCFVHLTPLTSLFRKTTDELEKIRANLDEITKEKLDWHFQIYFFTDDNNELKFRNVISKVLGKNNASFYAMSPKGYKNGEINLLYHRDQFYYSMQDTDTLMRLRDASDLGFYNKIPIHAYE